MSANNKEWDLWLLFLDSPQKFKRIPAVTHSKHWGLKIIIASCRQHTVKHFIDTTCLITGVYRKAWCCNRQVEWLRNQMETFCASLVLCGGNPTVTDDFPSQRPVMRSFGVSFDLCLTKRLSKQSRRQWFEKPLRSLWFYCNGEDIHWTIDVSAFLFPIPHCVTQSLNGIRAIISFTLRNYYNGQYCYYSDNRESVCNSGMNLCSNILHLLNLLSQDLQYIHCHPGLCLYPDVHGIS